MPRRRRHMSYHFRVPAEPFIYTPPSPNSYDNSEDLTREGLQWVNRAIWVVERWIFMVHWRLRCRECIRQNKKIFYFAVQMVQMQNHEEMLPKSQRISVYQIAVAVNYYR